MRLLGGGRVLLEGDDLNELRDFEALCLYKWKAGRELYGPVFQGNPITHFFEECADEINYLSEMARQELLLPEDIMALDDGVRANVRRLKQAIRRKREFDAGTSA